MYEGNWRKHVKHGKGRYNYANGDTYSGDWYKGQRHGVGIYSFKVDIENCCMSVRLKSTWNSNVRMGPFEMYLGNDDKCTILHGIWDELYPTGPAVFSFDNRYMLLGYFLPGNYKFPEVQTDNLDGEEMLTLEEEGEEEELGEMKPTLWFAQEIAVYDYSLLPQEPVPLPISDSELSICSATSEHSLVSEEKISFYGEAEEGEDELGEGEMECFPCECDYELSELETETEVCKIDGSPCAIEVLKQDE